jgi:hypothetical protein
MWVWKARGIGELEGLPLKRPGSRYPNMPTWQLIDVEANAIARAKIEQTCSLVLRVFTPALAVEGAAWKPVLPPDCYVHVQPAGPAPHRALNRPLANRYMEWVAAEERQKRCSGGGFGHIDSEEDIHRVLYKGEGVPDCRCVCHVAAGFDNQDVHGRLCSSCHDWLKEHRGASREDRVVAVARARLTFDLRCFDREAKGYRREVVLRLDPADEEDHQQKSIPDRRDFGGIGRGDEGGTDENPKLREDAGRDAATLADAEEREPVGWSLVRVAPP